MATRRVLYLLSGEAADATLIPRPDDPSVEATVVLIENAVGRRDLAPGRVSVLREDAAARQITASYPAIGYRDLLQMIFASDAVVTI